MLTDVQAAAALRAMPLFRGVEEPLLQGLLASTRYTYHDKGTVFLIQDQPVTRFYIILEGWCGAVKNNSDGQESVLQIFRTGDFLPEPGAAATMTNSPVNLQALTKTHLAMLTPSLVRNALEHSKAFAANMLAANNQRCNELRNHIEQLTLHSAEERVGRFFLDMRLMQDKGRQDVELPFDKNIIASYLGIKSETFSRTLKEFKEYGFSIDRNHIHMPDENALCDFCDTSSAQNCDRAHEKDCPHEEENKLLLP